MQLGVCLKAEILKELVSITTFSKTPATRYFYSTITINRTYNITFQIIQIFQESVPTKNIWIAEVVGGQVSARCHSFSEPEVYMRLEFHYKHTLTLIKTESGLKGRYAFYRLPYTRKVS